MKSISDILYKKLKTDTIKINWNKKPIKMELFLSFLTIQPERSHKHSGSDMGWTQLTSENLIIRGGIVNGIEYLDMIQYGKNLHNEFNNYVTPFQLFDIFNIDGMAYFVDYYNDEIQKIRDTKNSKILSLEKELGKEVSEYQILIEELDSIYNISKKPLTPNYSRTTDRKSERNQSECTESL